MSNHIRLLLSELKHKIRMNKHNIFYLTYQGAKNDKPLCNLWIASTTFFESISKMTFMKPRHSISFIASSKAIDYPPMMGHFPCIHDVPASTNCPLWSRIHHLTLVIPMLSWNPTSTLHLYHPCLGFRHWSVCCWLPDAHCFRPQTLTRFLHVIPDTIISVAP
jgi:hypothetical protein